MTNKTMETALELVQNFFGLDTKTISSMSMRDACMAKMAEYKKQDEIGRAQLYALEVSEHEQLKRNVMAFSQEFVTAVKTISMFDYVPSAFRRETMRFFNSYFPTFDKNAAIALGRHFKQSLEYIKAQPGALLEKGEYKHLSNLVMKNLISKSRNEFFRRLKSNTRLLDQFKKRLDQYCQAIWIMVIQENGTIHSDTPLAEKIAAMNKTMREQVQEFLDEKCRVNKSSITPADTLYKAYEKWVIDKDYMMLGKKKFFEEVYNLLPFVSQETNGEKSFIKGVYVA